MDRQKRDAQSRVATAKADLEALKPRRRQRPLPIALAGPPGCWTCCNLHLAASQPRGWLAS